ncbi:hypothetical protein JC221_036 [Yersinia phage JC221]|nr:hypothetical protein JC221_036 [Yersinia phage JC221]
MARTIHDFKDSDVICFAMNGKMVLVRDGDDITLIVENVVRYSNATVEGMKAWLLRQHKAEKSILPADCKAHAKNLVWIWNNRAN